MPVHEPHGESAAVQLAQPSGDSSPSTPSRAARVGMRFLPSLYDVVFVCASLGILLTLQGFLLGEDGDAAWNLRIGEYILAHGLPRTEFMLSTNLGQPTLYYEWLAQVIYALALRLGGLNGVVALAALLVGLDMTLLFWALRRRGVPLLLALFLTLVDAWLTTSVWTARAQQFTLLLTLAWSELLWSYWRTGDRRLLWLFPLSAALWANLHPGFVGGLLMLLVATGVAWVFPARYRGKADPRSLGLTFVGALAATLINPWGPQLWQHIVAYLGDPLVLATTAEYLSPDFHTVYAQVFLVMVFLLVGSWLWLARTDVPSSPPSSTEPPLSSGPLQPATDFQVAAAFSPLAVALSTVWTLLALQSVRFVALWAVAVLPILGGSLALGLRVLSYRQRQSKLDFPLLTRSLPALRRLGQLDTPAEQSSRGPWALLGALVVLALVLNGGTLPGSRSPLLQARFDARTFPVAAVQRLKQDGLPPGNGFTTYTWGSYFDYALPAFHPFVDSRSDAYGPHILQQYLDIVGIAPNWSALLDQYHIRWALLPVGEPLAQVLALRPGWSCRPADDVGVAVLCRDQASP